MGKSNDKYAVPNLHRRWFRYGLRSLLVIMTLLCLWFGYHAKQAFDRRHAIAHIAKLGGAVWKQGQISKPTGDARSLRSKLGLQYENFVCWLFGDDLRREIVAVDLSAASISKQDLVQLAPIDEVQWLTITGERIDDKAVEPIRSFRRLRWLDISGTRVSLAGIQILKDLKSLEWLNVTGTPVKQSDIAALQSIFPNAEIGSPSKRVSANLPPRQSAAREHTSQAEALWSELAAQPYSENTLQEYLAAIQRSSAVSFPQWYISAVYGAKRKHQEPLLVFEIYNGRRGRFNLGCLLVFGPNGTLLRAIADERVQHGDLSGPTKQFDWHDDLSARIRAEQLAASRKQVIELTDLTGDGFDEIPTERRNQSIGSLAVRGESSSIYSSRSTDIPCIFCIGVPFKLRQGFLIDLGGMIPNLAYRSLDSGKLFLETPCYAPTPTGTTVLRSLPRRTLAIFYWSKSENTFIGPARGPQETWMVIERE